jgi:hypothetical protein
MRGIFFREQFKSPLAPLFQKGESIDWSMPTEIVGMNNLTCEKTKDLKSRVTKSMRSIALRVYFGQQWASWGRFVDAGGGKLCRAILGHDTS